MAKVYSQHADAVPGGTWAAIFPSHIHVRAIAAMNVTNKTKSSFTNFTSDLTNCG